MSAIGIAGMILGPNAAKLHDGVSIATNAMDNPGGPLDLLKAGLFGSLANGQETAFGNVGEVVHSFGAQALLRTVLAEVPIAKPAFFIKGVIAGVVEASRGDWLEAGMEIFAAFGTLAPGGSVASGLIKKAVKKTICREAVETLSTKYAKTLARHEGKSILDLMKMTIKSGNRTAYLFGDIRKDYLAFTSLKTARFTELTKLYAKSPPWSLTLQNKLRVFGHELVQGMDSIGANKAWMKSSYRSVSQIFTAAA